VKEEGKEVKGAKKNIAIMMTARMQASTIAAMFPALELSVGSLSTRSSKSTYCASTGQFESPGCIDLEKNPTSRSDYRKSTKMITETQLKS